ncbi:hypothetical protein [Phyllobacterium calauticae]|jgi:hypothetical protein|uniref:hypothetical protein n=1 Tax=Phyllobacterium calauticae TaxID=2817027 RepID=UPI001CBD72EE|nr:hypothetical protein [Phyllobacterium calauticae]MBZ3692017.1 hypothetical protein [Phyllobacterium calauticae]
MIINARMERRLSIAATALLTLAIFVTPLKVRASIEARIVTSTYTEVAEITPVDLLIRK